MRPSISYPQLALAFDSISYAVIVTDRHGQLLYWNQSAAKLIDLGRAGTGVNAAWFFPLNDGGDGWAGEVTQAAQCGSIETASDCVGSTGNFWAVGTVAVMRTPDGGIDGYVKIFHDSSKQRDEENDLRAAAQTDALTGLANRQAFDAKLLQCMPSETREDQVVILHLIDLDRFKEVNDTLGHHAGDLLLQQVAARIRSLARRTDFLARLGGDEFALLQFAPHDTMSGGVLAEKILAAIAKPFMLGGSEAHISASIGISLLPLDGNVPHELLRKADAALYRVKDDGKNGYSFFTDELDKQAHQRGADLEALREAVRVRQFHLAYQPKVRASDRTLIGMEVLLRCDHPLLRSRPTQEVINLAKSCGAMHALTEWILSSSCKQAAAWFAQGLPQFTICVNFCAKDLTDVAVLQLVDRALVESGLQGSDLEIELTEADLLDSKDTGVDILNRLRARGIQIALDDFGTGFSSLSYLTKLPVDLIKLDISFVQSLADGPRGTNIVLGIIGLAKSLDIAVVAEGIENSRELEFFRDVGDIGVQGHHICKPLTANAMSAWLHQLST